LFHRLSFALALLATLATAYPAIAAAPPSSDGPPRIVSLAPSLTEILFELGLSESVVGVTNYCDWPPEAAGKEKVGDYINPAVEKIVSLKPDIVFSLVDGKTTRILRNMGLKVYVFDPQNFSELQKTIRSVGELSGRAQTASAVIGELDAVVAAEMSRARRRGAGRPRIYVETHYPPAWSCSLKSFLGEAVGIIGCENIFAVARKGFFPVSVERIIKGDPEVILVLSGDENISSRPGFERLAAVRNSKVIIWRDRSSLVRSSPRMIRSIPALRRRIFPDEK
ncbi:MAG: helical backbone metal receptor, partial [Endomicrobiia bacterium]|nr:helical backbone metal receptor [Endomicrobiia bacterium]